MGFRVEEVTEASLTSDVFVVCLFQHSCRGLAGLSPSAFSEGWSGWTRPTMGEGGWGSPGRGGLQRGVEGGFLRVPNAEAG